MVTMNALHSLLKMVVAQQADELRLGVERAPVVLTSGVAKNLTLAETGERVLRQMLGTLLSPEAEAHLARGEAYSCTHDAGEAFGIYRVQFLPRPKHDAWLRRPFHEHEPARRGTRITRIGCARTHRVWLRSARITRIVYARTRSHRIRIWLESAGRGAHFTRIRGARIRLRRCAERATLVPSDTPRLRQA